MNMRFLKKEIRTFSVDSVLFRLEFEIDHCPSDFRLVGFWVPPVGEQYKSYPMAAWNISKVYYSATDTTTFLLETRMLWFCNGRDFPFDNYSLTFFVGCTYDLSPTGSGFGWMDSPSENYDCRCWWSYIGNRSVLTNLLAANINPDWAQVITKDLPDSWLEFQIDVTHPPDFVNYANPAVNFVRFGPALPLLFVLLISILEFMLFPLMNSLFRYLKIGLRITWFKGFSKVAPTLVGLSSAMIVSLPLFQLSIRELKYPLQWIRTDDLIFWTFLGYVGVLLLSLAHCYSLRVVKQKNELSEEFDE
jgi:hypothetical protein